MTIPTLLHTAGITRKRAALGVLQTCVFTALLLAVMAAGLIVGG
ncbi:hypothetical protein J2792_002384 [Novosphingobium capsulatum]|uniref:ABC transporter permease n=1 Tax=Novosphingobium capsulatum TaxID=13688 RepID=A0ABU1MML8_9SPHN|nr:hypothetical protein [Novosphingobium capsulatum]MDR6511512.1 hypothetical protein [Novosphingobium capsulatum]